MSTDYTKLEKSRLVAMAQGGDRKAYGQLYKLYADRIYVYLRERVGNIHDAEDLMKQTFLNGLEKIESYEDRGFEINAWFRRIAHNLYVDFVYRRRRVQVGLPETDQRAGIAPGPGPEDSAEEFELEKELMEWVRISLVPNQREVIVLGFCEDLSDGAIARVLGIPPGSVRVLRLRALRRLLGAKVFQMQQQEDLSFSQIAARLGKNEEDVRSAYNGFINGLKKNLDEGRLLLFLRNVEGLEVRNIARKRGMNQNHVKQEIQGAMDELKRASIESGVKGMTVFDRILYFTIGSEDGE